MCGDNNEAKGDILLCDSCDAEYHLSCCTPPLKVCPEGEWFCLTCRKNRGEPVTKLFNEVRKCQDLFEGTGSLLVGGLPAVGGRMSVVSKRVTSFEIGVGRAWH
ncbi:unnamed protein product, partial [Ectocarpus sp. 8 AP-2014]